MKPTSRRDGKGRAKQPKTPSVYSDPYVDVALAIYRSGRLPETERACLDGLSVDPANASLLNLLGVVRMSLGRMTEAETALHDAVRIAPNYAAAWSNLGNALRGLSRLSEAEDAYKKAISEGPQLGDAYLNYGGMMLDQGRFAEAIELLQYAVPLTPSSPTVHNLLGVALLSTDRPSEAVTCFRRAVIADPTFDNAFGNLATALLQDGAPADAMIQAQRALALAPDRPDYRLTLAEALLALDRPADAVATAAQAADCANGDWRVWWRCGEIAESAGDLAAAVTFLGQSTSMESNPQLYNAYGGVLLSLGRVDEAVAAYGKAAVMAPQLAAIRNNLGLALEAAGQFDAAKLEYAAALEADPTLIPAMSNYGNILKREGDYVGSAACYRRAIALAPEFIDPMINLADLFDKQGKQAEAITLLNQALKIDPRHRAASVNLANLLISAGDNYGAENIIVKLLSYIPSDGDLWLTLGNIRRAMGRLEDAINCYIKAYTFTPSLAEAHLNISLTLQAQNKFREAEEAVRQALAVRPRYGSALATLGALLELKGNYDEALEYYIQSTQSDANCVEGWTNLGEAYRRLARQHRDPSLRADALRCFQRALKINPNYSTAATKIGLVLCESEQISEGLAALAHACDINSMDPDALLNYGSALQKSMNLSQALPLLERAVSLRPNEIAAQCNIGLIKFTLGDAEGGVAYIKNALAKTPDYPVGRSNYLFMQHFIPGPSSEDLFAEARFYNKMYSPENIRSVMARGAPDKKLRVGFVSPDFRAHVVTCFFEEFFNNRDKSIWEAYLYSDVEHPDAATGRLRSSADGYCDCFGWSHAALMDRIQADNIDILFDLVGHTAGNRLTMFAQRAAPIQASWIGYFDTTGLDAMDYIIADPVCVPPEHERWYSEKVLRLPDGFLVYAPSREAPDVSPCPYQRAGRITFGSANQLAKLTPQVMDVWADLLTILPDAQLKIIQRPLNDDGVRSRLQEAFASRGLCKDRVELRPGGTPLTVFQFYSEIDIALDSFPCVGGTTTCEALWQGVPVITLMGERFCSRHSASHLNNIGASELITNNWGDYKRLALSLSADVEKLDFYRRHLRGQMAASPLCDAARFARNFEVLLRQMWIDTLAKQSS